MAIREIRIFGDPVLKARCSEIHEINANVTALVHDLLETVQLPGRAGVAANQIGVGLRAFSYLVDGVAGYVINPKIVELSGEPVATGEGCLSVPGLWFEVQRYPFARVEGVNLDGDHITIEGNGLLAQALQHECDHLDGTLYLDRLDDEAKRRAFKQIRESDWFTSARS